MKTLIGFLSILMLISCSKEKKVEEIIRPVRYQQVFASGGDRVRIFSGVAQAGAESKISPKVAGTIEKVYVRLGDKVKKGQMLVQLDQTDYEIQFKEAEAARDQARAREIQADNEYKRVQTLYENRTASKAQLEAARATYESAHEQDNIAKRRRKLARNQLEYCSIKAPADGAISQVLVDENENVGIGQTLLVLTSGSDIEVKVSIPEILISEIREGNEVEVTFDAIRDKKFAANVVEVGISSARFATTYPVTVRMKEKDTEIRPGMAAEVAFTFSSEDDRVRYVVPPVSVGEDQLGRFVFTVNETDSGFGIIAKKQVTTGELTYDGLEILEGLKDGEKLVTAGISKIQDGQKVRM